MVYGLIFLGPTKFSAQEQRSGIMQFQKKMKVFTSTIKQFFTLQN